MPPGTAISSSRAGWSEAQNPVRAPAGQEDETARRGAEGVALTADGWLAVQHVEAFILAVVDMQGRSGPDAGLKDAQGSARRRLRRLQTWIACQARASRNHIAGQDVGHEIHHHPGARAGTGVIRRGRAG